MLDDILNEIINWDKDIVDKNWILNAYAHRSEENLVWLNEATQYDIIKAILHEEFSDGLIKWCYLAYKQNKESDYIQKPTVLYIGKECSDSFNLDLLIRNDFDKFIKVSGLNRKEMEDATSKFIRINRGIN